MIGLVEHVNHGPTAIHRIFISEDGSAKLPTLVPVAGGAVRLAQARAGGNGSAPSAFDPKQKSDLRPLCADTVEKLGK
jgi:hypothetical protein